MDEDDLQPQTWDSGLMGFHGGLMGFYGIFYGISWDLPSGYD